MLLENETELMRQVRWGDRLAAERLIGRYRRTVTRIAYQALGNADDAQDVAQEALVYALQRLSELRDPSRFSAWLRQITLSLRGDYRRRRGTRRLGEPITVLNEAREEADFAERIVIRQALAHLSEAHRTTLLLHYVGGWSREEVADLLGIPVNTVRSRLMHAKRHLRTDLSLFVTQRKPMSVAISTLSANQTALLTAAFPQARVLAVQEDPEPWMPFRPRVRLALADGTEKTLDFRGDIAPASAALYPLLERLGIPSPRLVYGPVASGDGYLSLCEVPRGENLLLWALGGTPHRIRLATERAFEAIDRLQGATEALLANPLGAALPRRTLVEEADLILADAQWNADSWLAEASRNRAEWLAAPWFQ